MTLQFEKCGYETRITFPYDKGVIKAIKGLGEYRYEPDERAWYVPNWVLPDLQKTLPHETIPEYLDLECVRLLLYGNGFKIEPEIQLRDPRFLRMNLTQNPRSVFRMAEILSEHGVAVEVVGYDPITGLERFPTGPKLYPFQEEGVRFLQNTGSCLLADDMGLGKTIQTLEYARREEFDSMMIMATSLVTEQWDAALKEHFDFDGAALITGRISRQRRKELYQEPLTIVSYDILRRDEIFPHVSCLVLDEAQNVKNWTTQRAQAVSKIVAPTVIGVTGTPLQNNLSELFYVIDQIIPAHFGSFAQFQEKYIIRNYYGKPTGYRNLPEVYETLHPIMCRRLKHEVEADLPERVEKQFDIDFTPEERGVYEHIMNKGRSIGVLAELKATVSNPAVKMPLKSGLSTKEKVLKKLLTEELSEQKVVVFTEFKKNIPRLMKIAKSINMPAQFIHGGMQRQVDGIKRNFEKMDRGILFLTDVGMAGMDKLQTAKTLINFDLPWNPSDLEQRAGRIERMGSTHTSVLIINLAVRDSIDDHILEVLNMKEELFAVAVDGVKSYILERVFEDCEIEKAGIIG